MLTEVWGSTLQDRTHKGPNQSGNKSLLSYNPALGVPGATVYIPAHHQVVLPIKCFEHTGKPVDNATRDAAVEATVEKSKVSEYATTFKKKPSDTAAFSKSGGGYWITKPLNVESPVFNATTTYQNEMLNGSSTTAHQLRQSVGLACTVSQYEAARATAPRAQTADSALRSTSVGRGLSNPSLMATVRPATAMTSTGDVVGYQTTNMARFVHNPLVGGPAAPGAPRRSRDDPPEIEPRYQTMPRAMPPGMHGASSSYVKDFGEDCSDPMERTAPSERFQTRCSTTKDLAAGSTRNTNNPPGYTGHISAYKYNELAQAQSAAADERMNRQNDMLLFSLDQFARSRLPGYTGYKPQAARNVTTVQLSQGPVKNTTQGAANLQGTKYAGMFGARDTTHCNNSRAGIMDFFSSTGEHLSENGLADAQQYYRLCKPGMNMKLTHLPHSTHYGKPFNPRNSLV